MNNIKHFFIIILAVWLFGCNLGDKSDPAALQKNLASFDIDKEQFNAYAKLKGIPSTSGARYDRAIKVFAERNGLARVISDESGVVTPELLAELKESRNEIIIKHYFDDYVNKTVNDSAIEEYYQSHSDDYTTRKARISQILFALPPSANTASRMKKMEIAKQLAEDLRNGDDFEQAVMKYTDDNAGKEKHGELGWVEEAGAKNNLASIAVTMNEGGVSEPIELPDAIAIIKVLEGPISEVQPLTDVKDKIAYKLKYDAKVKEMERLQKIASTL